MKLKSLSQVMKMQLMGIMNQKTTKLLMSQIFFCLGKSRCLAEELKSTINYYIEARDIIMGIATDPFNRLRTKGLLIIYLNPFSMFPILFDIVLYAPLKQLYWIFPKYYTTPVLITVSKEN